MNMISYLLLPIMIISIILYGYYKKCDLYTSFITGAKEGIQSAIRIFPFTVSMVFAINIFLHSGVLDAIFSHISFLLPKNISISLFPMALLRPISGTASLAIMSDIFKNFGPDSLSGLIASTLQGSTDTTFYVITLYFGSVGITKIRYALKAGLFADIIGIIASFIIIYLIFAR